MKPLTLSLAIVLLFCGSSEASVVAGGGEALVTQGPDASAAAPIVARVRMVGALAENVTQQGGVLVRFQFVRPDGRAVAFLILTLPHQTPLSGKFSPDSPGVELLYYEQAPADAENQLFVSTVWTGDVVVYEPLSSDHDNVTVGLRVTVVDEGPDEKAGSADDQTRILSADDLLLAVQGDLSGLSYTYVGDEVYVSNDAIIVLEDGCSGSPDYYDDPYYYDSPEYTDDSEYSTSDESWDGSSCDGDTTDDSSSSSDWDDSSDSSCSADDGYGDSSSSSSCEGDTFDDDTDESASEAASVVSSVGGGRGSGQGLRSISGIRPVRNRGAERMTPLLGALVGWMAMRLATRRRLRTA